ncbi:MAG TPA: cytochrome b N-terminal domain-containing protein [Jatrophihabitans sp.]|nr:cytochrome b N-terminal domain-containing protein [Jatrophihabitans sp.]
MTATAERGSWTASLRHRLARTVPPGQVLPDRQPAYVASWIYVFGVLSLASLLLVLASGIVLTVGGPTWWHTNAFGHFVNSTHLWSVELFFATMVIHLWGKFFMAAWRGKRGLTWVTGGLAFFGSLGTAFTGYLSQTNFDSQWISTQAKDGLNAAGIGAYFNVLNGGQMLMWHITLLPLLVGVIVLLHVVLVRRHGVVPPIDETGWLPGTQPPEREQPPEPAGRAEPPAPVEPPVRTDERVPTARSRS